MLEDNPYGLLRYEGDAAADAALARRRVRDLREHVLEDPLARACGSAGRSAPAPVLEKMNIGKQASDLCSSSISQYFVSAYFDSGPWEDYVRSLIEIYRRRRDVMLDALAEHFPREAEWTHPQGGLFIWATLPDYIDTTDLLARALDEHVAFVPGRAAYVDGRGGSSMRLNFSGVDEDEIREGIRRLGEVVREQVALYGTLTGAHGRRAAPAARSAAPRAEPRRAAPELRRPGQARERAAAAAQARARLTLMRVAVLKGGRSLERQVSLRSGARVAGRARAPRPRGVPIDVGADLVDAADERPRPRSRSSRCTGATARTGPCRSCSR